MLALMISSSTEDCELCITYSNQWEEAKLKSDVLLENVRSVLKQIKVHILLQHLILYLFLI